MEFIRGLYNLPTQWQGCVATIGNFDGLHLGHIALLKKLTEQAQKLKLPATVILFEPQPNEYFGKDNIPPRLMRLREKILGLKKFPIDRVLCLHFDDQFAKKTAEQFVTEVLFAGLKVRYVVVGDDFRFGFQRRGDIQLLQKMGEEFTFQTECLPTFCLLGERVSSTRVRHFLSKGEMETAQTLLGRQFSLLGRVVHGDKRGRILGFPTANIYLHRKVVPIAGVFVVDVLGLTENPVLGVANVGIRPTVAGTTRSLLEVHLFDFNRDIYGRSVEVRFLHKLRDEKKFASLELLQQQILQDAEQAKFYFKKRHPTK
jgi:riboflavin kinase / FMN adenylyltransferase